MGGRAKSKIDMESARRAEAKHAADAARQAKRNVTKSKPKPPSKNG